MRKATASLTKTQRKGTFPIVYVKHYQYIFKRHAIQEINEGWRGGERKSSKIVEATIISDLDDWTTIVTSLCVSTLAIPCQ